MKTNIVIDVSSQSHVWQNSGSRVIDQNSVSQSNCGIPENNISNKHQSLLQVDTINLGVCNQACPKYPK